MSERRTASALAYLHPDFCFIMDDDSMECAGIRAGDIVAFTACDHAEDSQIVAVQTDSAVLLLRQICNGELLADAPRTRREHVIRFDELPGSISLPSAKSRILHCRAVRSWGLTSTSSSIPHLIPARSCPLAALPASLHRLPVPRFPLAFMTRSRTHSNRKDDSNYGNRRFDY